MSNSDSPIGRTYDPKKLLSDKIIKSVFDEFRDVAGKIFGQNLEFGFVVGGAAGGYAVEDQDIDFFICINRHNDVQYKNWLAWYFKLHDKYGLKPDRTDPGEIVERDTLIEKLKFVRHRPLRPVIETFYEYEAIVWGDMLTGNKAAMVGSLEKLNLILEIVEDLPQRWRIQILKMIGNKVSLETAKLSTTRLFRHAITYLKEGNNTRPNSLISEG